MIDHKRIEFLTECVGLSNDEWGETTSALLDAYSNCKYVSDQFRALLEEELLGQLEWAEEHCRIVTRTETREVTFKELEVDD